MPTKRSKSSKNLIEQEGNILLAIQALKRSQIQSIQQAARTFEVPYSTLQNRLKGRETRPEKRPNGHKLTEAEEESFIQ